MKVKVNEDCIGCGLCVELCPQVFQMGEDGMSHAVSSDETYYTEAMQGAEMCPVNAIEVNV